MSVSLDSALPEPRAARRAFDRAIDFDASAVVHAEARRRLLERLPLFRVDPRIVVDLGCATARGSVELHERLKSMLKKRGLAETEVRACTSSCLDTCWVGPTIAVEPDHYFYGRVKESDLEEIVDALEQGTRVERLVLAPDDFTEPKELRAREP